MFTQNVFALFLASCLIAVNAQLPCSTPDGMAGECVSLYNCPKVLARFKGQVQAVVPYLRSLQCESDVGRFPHVCCMGPDSLQTPQPAPQKILQQSLLATRTTPRPLSETWSLLHQHAKQEPFSRAPPLIREPQVELTSAKPRIDIGLREPQVELTSVKPRIDISLERLGASVLPYKCPMSSTTNFLSYRAYGGTNMHWNDFPWTVLLEYQNHFDPREKRIGCGGSLINSRYILTAAHCLGGEMEEKFGKLIGVRLGRFDISNEINYAEMTTYVGVEEMIPHPSYSGLNGNLQNDIGLVRLEEEVTYTNYIKPICLPSISNSLPFNPNGFAVAPAERDYGHPRILRVIKPSVSDYTQLYASGIEGQDTCEGNSGNALVKIQSSSWVLEGVMSYRQNCWEQNRQPVCIAVSSFDQWIRSNLRQ